MGKKDELVDKVVLKSTINGPIVAFNSSKKYSLTDAISICECNEFLRNLGTGFEIKFENFNQYNRLLNAVALKLKIPYLFE